MDSGLLSCANLPLRVDALTEFALRRAPSPPHRPALLDGARNWQWLHREGSLLLVNLDLAGIPYSEGERRVLADLGRYVDPDSRVFLALARSLPPNHRPDPPSGYR